MSPESALLPLAESIADGSVIDWHAAETHASPQERAVLRELRVLANLALLHRSLPLDAAASTRRPPPVSTPAIGTWGHLDLLERLGGGTFGEVYRAWDRQLEREVALKLLRAGDPADARERRGALGPPRASAPGGVQPPSREATAARRSSESEGGGAPPSGDDPQTSRIAIEGRLLARLRHPNVIAVHGIAVHDNRVGLWMELVRGATLEQTLQKRGAFSAREAALVGIDLCRALAAVHAAGLIHRDVKAQNVMREDGGRIVLMDLGTGRESGGGAQALGDLAGTPLYLAPEIFDGAPAGARTDLYSLGVLLYRLVTGAFPARAATMEELRAVHAKGRAVRLRDARADLPTAFVRIVDRAIDSDPNRRYESAGALEADLARALDDVSAAPPIEAPGTVRVAPPAWWRTLRPRSRPAAALVAGVVALAAVAGIYWTAFRDPAPVTSPGVSPAAAPIRSIAVLPLENLTGDPSQEYFADGMTDELISTLGRIEGLNVISRTSVIQFKNSRTPLERIAQALKVDAFLEGSVLFVPAAGASANGGQAARVRINVRLLRAGTDTQIVNWTSFETVLSDVLSLQSRIATTVADAIKLELTSEQQQSLAARPQDPDTLDLYLRGRYYWNLRTEEGLKRSIQYFQEAIARDKKYARAYAGLADAYSLLGRFGFMPRNEALAQAAAASKTAIGFDDSLAEAHASLALVQMERLEWDAAAASFKRALDLNPGYASGHHWYSAYLARRGQLAEAMASIDRALALDPLSLGVKGQRAALLLLSRRVDDAIGELQKLVDANPGFAKGHMLLAEAYAEKGSYDRAIASIAKAAQLGDRSLELRASTGYIYARAGRRTQALAIANELAQRHRRNEEGAAGGAAVVYAGLGERDRAFEWLDRAVALRDPSIAYLRIDSKWDKLRPDPRFERLLASAGLPR